MTALLDRLREALAPDYEVEREVASGGMGVVFLGRDVALDRRVAIKILKPELATAAAAERFVREARILASLNHPNIIPVHRAGSSGGLSYYVMDFLGAETLADRLSRGPLPAAEAAALGRDVLAALEAAHGRGVVHRDVKPANIFLLKGRAVLADFGIAKDTAAAGTTLTADGRVVGSPGYMAPEQMAGGDVGAATDLYATGLVLYEALTGENWSLLADPATGDWSRVPPRLVPVLRRALAWRSEDRWHTAAGFRRALTPARAQGWPRRSWIAAAAVVAGAVIVVDLLVRPAPAGPSTLRIRVRPFVVGALAAAPPALGDSLAAALVQSLGGSPDFSASVASGGATADSAALTLRGTAALARDGTLLLTLASETDGGRAEALDADVRGTLATWRTLASDSLANRVLLWIWSRQGGHLAADLPYGALPRTKRGLETWIEAERYFVRAEWESAYEAYGRAIAADSTCLLCRVRLTDIARWVGVENDPASTARYRHALDAFPPHYRLIIEASFEPEIRRMQLLDDAVDRAPDFGLAWFIRGDEIFHRGPLAGYLRNDALTAMQRATTLWPDFAPAWEHLAWIALGEDRPRVARTALDNLARVGGRDVLSTGIRTLLEVCYRFRFAPAAEAEGFAQGLLKDPRIASLPMLAVGARYLMTCDAPAGSVWLGEAFQHVGQPQLEAPGLLAEVYGNLALGRPASAFAAGDRVRAVTGEPDVELFLAELPVAVLLADSAPSASVAGAARALGQLAVSASDSSARRRATWLLALGARYAGADDAARLYRDRLGRDRATWPFRTLADADADAARGRLGAALHATEPLLALDSAWQAGDPFFRALLHLMRAQWHAASGDTDQAVRDLRWHENNDLRAVTSPAQAPEAGEVDWALGTLARWRRARLAETRHIPEACRAYLGVARLWSGGEPRFAVRADTARSRASALGCGRTP